MTDTDTRVNTARLLDLGRWLTVEERARRLGKPSHWNQSVWVRTETDDIEELPVQVLGVPDGEQPQVVRWSCGTAACAAGHIAIQDGGLPVFRQYGEDPSPVPPPMDDGTNVWDWLESLSSSEMFFGGRLETIEDHSREALGLDTYDANRLFHGDNTWDEMVNLISGFTGIPEHQLVVLIGAEDMPVDPDADDYEEDDEDSCANGCTCGDEDYDE